MSILSWIGEMLTRSEDTPPVEVITRDYEWQDTAGCSDCRRTTEHTYIEWLPDRVVTRECHLCNLETEVAREEAGTEAVDH